ncbi:MAG: PA2169 family four-helix-bundle protein [Ferruginibacter sp.]|nr:PA2169 family four-helix-bundle protein [Ferruginibacter sp.]
MENSQATIETLNDLITINNDRIAGYEKAMEELDGKEKDLTLLFEKMVDESRDIRNALGREVQVLGGEMAEGTMAIGKIYRAWMDVRAVFTGHDRHTVLENCHTGEHAAQRAYTAALEEKTMPHFLRDMISTQQRTLQSSHDEIKALTEQTA